MEVRTTGTGRFMVAQVYAPIFSVRLIFCWS
jgi:hypothetical protein